MLCKLFKFVKEMREKENVSCSIRSLVVRYDRYGFRTEFSLSVGQEKSRSLLV